MRSSDPSGVLRPCGADRPSRGLAARRKIVYLHVMTDSTIARQLQEVSETCVCLHARMAARAVTRAYDDALAPLGLEATQFTLLAAIAANPEKSITALADRLALERSSLSRNLKHLAGRGLIVPAAVGGRAAAYEVTPAGEALLSDALPLWSAVQRKAESAMGSLTWGVTRDTLRQLRRGLRAS
jgi:DNA-binding MarR family transcriptional regulator